MCRKMPTFSKIALDYHQLYLELLDFHAKNSIDSTFSERSALTKISTTLMCDNPNNYDTYH